MSSSKPTVAALREPTPHQAAAVALPALLLLLPWLPRPLLLLLARCLRLLGSSDAALQPAGCSSSSGTVTHGLACCARAAAPKKLGAAALSYQLAPQPVLLTALLCCGDCITYGVCIARLGDVRRVGRAPFVLQRLLLALPLQPRHQR
jgi:hypothetical protein